MTRLVFVPPDQNEPGYLRRFREATRLLNRMDRLDPKAQDDLIDFLSQWVEEPKTDKEVKELLLDLSKNEFRGILARLFGGDESPLAEKPK